MGVTQPGSSERSVRRGYERLHDLIELPLQILVVLAAFATIPIIYIQEHGEITATVTAADWAVWVIFLTEFALLGLCAANRAQYSKGQWLSILIIVLSFPALPDLLHSVRVLRVARLMRIARLLRVVAVTARAIKAMRDTLGGQSLIFVSILTTILVVSGGALLAFLEPEVVQDGFWGGLWWAFVTVTTVGYGDISPETFGGRFLAVVLMLCGLGLISTLAASISAYFIGAAEDPEIEQIKDRLERIEQKLDRVLDDAD